LSQIFDYGDTAIEKRAIFYKRLIALLEFGRERESIDLSKLKLTHHAVKSQGKAAMPLGVGEKPLLYPLTEVGSGIVREKETAYLSVVVDKLSSLFGGDLTDQDKVIYVTQVIMGKLLESELLVEQATTNSKEQFAGSPDLMPELENAIIDALEAHRSMSTQAINSESVQAGLADILLNHVGLWERLRERAAARSL
jgi:type I restriction enzyme R subunit